MEETQKVRYSFRMLFLESIAKYDRDDVKMMYLGSPGEAERDTLLDELRQEEAPKLDKYEAYKTCYTAILYDTTHVCPETNTSHSRSQSRL